jgi:hypothetical protein
MTAAGPPPDPMTAHPSVEYCADFARHLSAEGRDVITLAARPAIHRFRAIEDPMMGAPKPVTFAVQRCYGLAPFVGQPFHYEWRVAVDAYGRHIAGPAELVHHL